ncbi:MAG: hypothetical protein ABIN91_16170 [Mucilaginibacter sp.]|uniref:hypothetical protein n=1 Tax=Mucilaginibacter sp. TaxID=1882438 RepID=UPI003265626C
MNKLYTIAFFAVVVILTGCSDHYYAPVMYRNSASYMNKPMSTDSVKSSTYISLGASTGNGVNFKDEFYLGRIDLHEAHTFSNFNLAYGIYAFGGTYDNTSMAKTDPYYFDSKAFYGFGAKLSGSFYTAMNDHVDFRIIGFEFSYSNESGDYANFRNAVKTLPSYRIYDKNDVLNAGLTSEVIWKSPSGIKHALRGYLGTYFGPDLLNYSDYNDNLRQKIDPAVSYSLQVKNYFFVFDLQPLTSGTLRLGYSF